MDPSGAAAGRDCHVSGSILVIGAIHVFCCLSRTQIVQPEAVRTSLDDALSHHGIHDIVVGLTTLLAHNGLTGIESNAHDASRDGFYLIGNGHCQISEGDAADAKSIVEIVPLNYRIRGIIFDAKAAFVGRGEG